MSADVLTHFLSYKVSSVFRHNVILRNYVIKSTERKRLHSFQIRYQREFEHHQLLTKQLHICLSKKSYLHICIDVHYYDRFFKFLSSPLHILKNSSLLSKEKEIRTTPSNHMLDFCVLMLSIKTILFRIFFHYIKSFNKINKKIRIIKLIFYR